MKLKKSAKLVVSRKMFASTKSLARKDSGDKSSEVPKKKKKKNPSNTSPKKSPKKEKTSTPRSKTAHTDKYSSKLTVKMKTSKGAEKNLGSPYKTGITSGKHKHINWSELGVQRCQGCNFTTNEDGIFAAHLSLCRLYNKDKIKSPSTSTNKKQSSKLDVSVSVAEKPDSNFGKMIGIPEKRALIQEPYLEGSSPAQTVFLFRCYHCRSYFINIQTLKDHHRLAHGSKNLTVSLVPFTDDEAPDDLNKKIIVDGSSIVPHVNWRRENMTIIPASSTATLQCPTDLTSGVPNFIHTPVSSQSTVNTVTSAVATPQAYPKLVSLVNNPLHEVCVQTTPSPDLGAQTDGKVIKKGVEDIQKSPVGETFQNRLKLVPTQGLSSATNQSTNNKMVVLNLIPKSQSVPCSTVQIEIPTSSSVNAHTYIKQNLNLAQAVTQTVQTNQEPSQNLNSSAKTKTILPQNLLLGVHSTPVMDLPLIVPQTSKLSPKQGVTVISTAQKVIHTTVVQSINSPAITSSISSTKQKNRKIILFPLTSNASTGATLVTPGTTLTATPIATAIATSAVVTGATMTSPSVTIPLSSSFAGSSLQTTVSPLLISPTPTIIAASNVPSVWVLPSQTNLTSVGPKLISSPPQNTIPKPPQVLSKTIHVTPTPSKIMQPSSTSLCVTTQTVTTVTSSSPSSTSKNTSPNCSVQNQIVTITPVSQSTPSAMGMSLLEKVTIIKSNKSGPVATPEKLDQPSSDSASLKLDNVVKVSSNSKIEINEGSMVTCSEDDINNSKSTQCVLSTSNKRKINANSDVSLSQIVPSPKKKAYICSPTSASKRTNSEDSPPSLSTSTSKGISTSEDFTVALLAKKKMPISTTCTSIIKKSLSKSAISNVSPLVIVRKSVGSNKLVVHTMVSASKLFQIKEPDVLTCSLCSDKISVKLIKDHLYWHFHIENRNSAQCSKDNPCHYCSVIDYVVSTIPQTTQPEEAADTLSQTNPTPSSDNEKLSTSITKSQDSCSPVEGSNSVSTEPLGLKISSSFSLQTEENGTKQNEESSHVEPGKEESMQTDKNLEEKSKSSLDPPETTSPRKEPIENDNFPKSPIVDIETIDETENSQAVDNVEKNDVCDKVPLLINNSFKEESPSQAEKNTIYKGNFYICGFKDCSYSSLGMEAFQSHQEDHHCDADGYSCVHCQLECIDPSALVRHMVTHLCGDMFILYRCAFPECNFGTNLMRSFCGHNVEAHSREPIFLCYYCSDHFQGCLALQKHLQANLLKYVHCPHCSVRNGIRDTILSHIKTDHPDKPRRIFVTGQMVCQQKQKVQSGSNIIDSESESSDIDSDCMIVDDEILDRHLIKHNNISVDDIFGKEVRPPKACKEASSISEGQTSDSDDDCMIIDQNSQISQNSPNMAGKSPNKIQTIKKRSNVSPKDKIHKGTDPKLMPELTKHTLLKKNEAVISKQTASLTEAIVLNSSNTSPTKNTPKDLKNAMPTNTEKDSLETEEGNVYLRVKKVTQTYSRQKENRISLRPRQLVDKKESSKETSLKSKADGKNTTTIVKPCSRTILTRSNKSRGKVDIGTAGLDSIINRLYLAVDNEMHCRICTFKCILLMKMHAHILLMHLHVFLYQCNICRKKGSCKVEMTKHCDQHGQKNKGFAVLPDPDWEQVLRSCQPATGKTSNIKSPVNEATRSQTPLLNKTRLSKTENSFSSKKAGQKKSAEVLKPVSSKMASMDSSPNSKIPGSEDRNIFSLFSFDLNTETATQHNREESECYSSSKPGRFQTSFSNKLFSLPTLPSYDKTPVKNLPDRKLRQRTPTPESHERITVGKEQYMRELHLISISKVSSSKQKNSPPASMLPQLSPSLNLPMSRLRSWQTLGKAPFHSASKSQRRRKSKRPRTNQGKFISHKFLRKKVLSKASKLKIRAVRKKRLSGGGHLLRSISKLRHSPRNLKRRLEAIKPLLKTPEKCVARKRPQNLKNLSSSLPQKPNPPKLKVTKRLDMNLRKVKSNPRKLVKATMKRTVTKKKNLTISHGQRSIKKALNQASRKKSAETKGQILSKTIVGKRRPLIKISSSKLNTKKKQISIRGSPIKNSLYFSCSWCKFRVPDREHFQRHISLHNFFPQGSKMHCPYCSYTTPSALVLEKHIPMHMDKHPFGCRHCGFSAKTKMMVVRHCKRSHPDIPLKLVNRSTSSQKLKPSWPIVSFCPKVRLKKCSFKADCKESKIRKYKGKANCKETKDKKIYRQEKTT